MLFVGNLVQRNATCYIRILKPTSLVPARSSYRLPSIPLIRFISSRSSNQDSTKQSPKLSSKQDSNSHKNHEILKLIPNTGTANIIESSGRFRKNISVKSFLASELSKDEKLIVVSSSKVPGSSSDNPTDPQLVCKVVPITYQSNDRISSLKHYKDKKQKNETKSGTAAANIKKEMEISWNISDKDLREQKRTAIESVLMKKGNKLDVRLMLNKKKQRRQGDLTDLELERREMVLEKCKNIGEQYGTLVKQTGSVKSVVVLSFAPN